MTSCIVCAADFGFLGSRSYPLAGLAFLHIVVVLIGELCFP